MQKQEIEGKSQTSGERNMTGKENSLKKEYVFLSQLQQAKRRWNGGGNGNNSTIATYPLF